LAARASGDGPGSHSCSPTHIAPTKTTGLYEECHANRRTLHATQLSFEELMIRETSTIFFYIYNNSTYIMSSSKRPIIKQSGQSSASSGGDRQIAKGGVPNAVATVRWSGESKIVSDAEPRRPEAAAVGHAVWPRPRVCYCCPQDVMYATHKSTWWHIVTICASIVMIFFQPVVDIFDTNKGQPYISTVYYIITIIIIADVALKVSFDSEYFLWYCSCCKGTSCGNKQDACCCCRNQGAPTEDDLPERHHNKICSFGSLFFWLDILALAAFIANFALLYTVEVYASEININYDLYIRTGEVRLDFNENHQLV